MLRLDGEKFEQIVNEAMLRARQAPKDARRWERAIVKAYEFLSLSGLWHLTDDDTLLMLSEQSGQIYEVGEKDCEQIEGERRVYCPAYERGVPCFHKAARKLVLNYIAETEIAAAEAA
jgi:hypothetical protein